MHTPVLDTIVHFMEWSPRVLAFNMVIVLVLLSIVACLARMPLLAAYMLACVVVAILAFYQFSAIGNDTLYSWRAEPDKLPLWFYVLTTAAALVALLLAFNQARRRRPATLRLANAACVLVFADVAGIWAARAGLNYHAPVTADGIYPPMYRVWWQLYYSMWSALTALVLLNLVLTLVAALFWAWRPGDALAESRAVRAERVHARRVRKVLANLRRDHAAGDTAVRGNGADGQTRRA